MPLTLIFENTRTYIGRDDEGNPAFIDNPGTQDYRSDDQIGRKGTELFRDPEALRDKRAHRLKRGFGVDKFSELEDAEIYMFRAKSSHVGKYGYHRPTNTLVVSYHTNGSTYLYYKVPIKIFSALKRTVTVGGGLHAAVFPKYKYDKVGGASTVFRPKHRRQSIAKKKRAERIKTRQQKRDEIRAKRQAFKDKKG